MCTVRKLYKGSHSGLCIGKYNRQFPLGNFEYTIQGVIQGLRERWDVINYFALSRGLCKARSIPFQHIWMYMNSAYPIMSNNIALGIALSNRSKQLLYTDRSACMTRQNEPTPAECVVNGTECYDSWVWAIHLFIKAFSKFWIYNRKEKGESGNE